MRLENKLCDTCKVNRVYDVCDREHGITDKVIGCPHYIPTEFYYRGGEPWPKCLAWGTSYSTTGMKNEDIAKAVKEIGKENELSKCASEIGILTKEMYDCLYDIIQEEISKNEHNLCYRKYHPEEYSKCLVENVNICIGRFFAYIQRMEDNGYLYWDESIKELKRNNTIRYGKDITVTYQENNMHIVQNLIFDNDKIIANKKELIFEHGWTRYSCSHDEKDRTECVIKVFAKQVSKIEKSKADWLTSIRRYTITFNNKRKMYFDMY